MHIKAGLVAVAALSVLSVFAKALPSDYKALDYVESETHSSGYVNAGQFINTGVVPNGGVPLVRLKYQMTDSSGEGYAFGYWNADVQGGTAIGILNGQGRYRVFKTAIYYGTADKNVHEFELNTPDGTFMDGTRADAGTDLKSVADPESSGAYHLFARFVPRSGAQRMSCRIYRAAIWLNGEKVRDYIPCLRLSDSKAGMYEMVEGKFCLGEGRIAFKAGPEMTYVDDGLHIGAVAATPWTGTDSGPHPEVRDANGSLLAEGTDYALSWKLADDQLHGIVEVSGIGARKWAYEKATYPLKFTEADLGKSLKTLKYLEAQEQAGSFVDTGVVPNGKVPTVLLKYQMLKPSVDNRYAFGYYDVATQTGTAIGIYDSKIRYRVKGTTGYGGKADDKVHTMLLNSSDGTYLDGQLIDTTLKDKPDAFTGSYHLFARHAANGDASTSSACRIYGATIWLDGVKVRDYVPCMVVATGECGLFDKVTGMVQTSAVPLCHYAKLEYAEATGKTGEQIKALAPGKKTPMVELVCKFTKVYNENWAMGYWSGTGNTGTAIGMSKKDGSVQMRYRVGDAGGFYGTPDTQRHTILLNSPQGTFVDGRKIGDPQNAVDPGLASFDLFGRNDGKDEAGCVQIFSCKIWLDGVLKADYIPVRRSYDGAVGLYDKVSKTFLTAADYPTRNLTAGPELPDDPGVVVIIR